MSYRVEKAPLRRYMPHADGKANPMQWWVFDRDNNTLAAGPFDRARQAWAAAANEAKAAHEARAA